MINDEYTHPSSDTHPPPPILDDEKQTPVPPPPTPPTHRYDVVFENGPLGLGIDENDFGFAVVKLVAEGGQAARGGVKVKDVLATVDSCVMNCAEALTALTQKPRPITVSFQSTQGSVLRGVPTNAGSRI